MSGPWEIYDELIETIPGEVTVTSASLGLRWCRVTSDEGGLGIAYTMDERSRPACVEQTSTVGVRLRDVAALAKSWNFAEAGIGMAAVNAWYGQPERAEQAGFARCAVNPWHQMFEPFADVVAGKVVSVIGHFPFAPASLRLAGEVRMLERQTQPGDFPDPACEYLLGDSDYVFISASAFVNKTMPRLLELAADATTAVVGPSTPLHTGLFDRGVDVLNGFVANRPVELAESLGGLSLVGMFEHGYRVEQRAEEVS